MPEGVYLGYNDRGAQSIVNRFERKAPLLVAIRFLENISALASAKVRWTISNNELSLGKNLLGSKVPLLYSGIVPSFLSGFSQNQS
jgi:hypothetical protein